MNKLLVTGYASMDYPVALAGTVQPDQTTHINHRNANAWPRIGGSPYYVASAASRRGMEATPVTWVGDDALGQLFLRTCSEADVSTMGVSQLEGQRSPLCLMIHQNNGSTSCLFDSAFPGSEKLTEAQRNLIATTEIICVTVGPGHMLEEILSLIPSTATLFWIAKNDKTAFPSKASKQLAKRASVIFCNQSERAWIANFQSKNGIIVETAGAGGCKIITTDTEEVIAAKPVKVTDPTGAGDTFAGGFIEAFSRTGDPLVAAKSGMNCAREMLEQRKLEE